MGRRAARHEEGAGAVWRELRRLRVSGWEEEHGGTKHVSMAESICTGVRGARREEYPSLASRARATLQSTRSPQKSVSHV